MRPHKAIITARKEHKIMVVRTKRKASGLKRSIEFEEYLRRVAQGLTSPLFQLSWFDSSAPEPDEKAYTETVATHPMSTILCSGVDREFKSVHLMNEGEQSNDESSRLVRMCLYAKYAAFISDFMPEKTRNNESPYYLCTGKFVDLNLLKVKCFGPAGIYSLLDGPIDKRAQVGEEGWLVENKNRS